MSLLEVLAYVKSLDTSSTVSSTVSPTDSSTVSPTDSSTVSPTDSSTVSPTDSSTVSPTDSSTVSSTDSSTLEQDWSSQIVVGTQIDCCASLKRWTPVRVVKRIVDLVRIHFDFMSSNWDQWVSLKDPNTTAPLGTKCKIPEHSSLRVDQQVTVSFTDEIARIVFITSNEVLVQKENTFLWYSVHEIFPILQTNNNNL